MLIRPFQPSDEAAVVDLWQRCDLTRPWNDPYKDIQRKLQVQPELFLVGEIDGTLVASAMAGYEGHRGWVNYLAVCPQQRQRGLARQLMAHIETLLLAMGCPKLSLQVRDTNAAALAFYERLGYQVDASVSLGKRLIADD
ncbi:Acetyltransferase YpeA [Pseudomonas sp. THAF187a]|uniref:GNAT family acetyltransferase n=1 Tax=Pseudomonadaceae TaxID=135621 RepID=UPI000646703F|nr:MULTISPECIES: GNAT family acetyltransferase [Pseudomonas]QFT22796.1 Acetyltransferase YpeA [Pseudomonas sp. THAF187a]QFT42983.1 Acetyltransferase YpeA [Pseudomonas sp. THAF42]QTS84720.1 GNAT family acetyltransferase [Pseudomonas khazarica]|tara:strand:+ start:3059 stop:3478 length:420 start_codon:yes stop_codon:yes gene_type:complete